MIRGEPTLVRALLPGDAEAVAALFVEMQAHYGVPCPPRDAIVADLLHLPPGVRLLVAEDRGRVVGFASLSPIHPGPGLRRGLFPKELFVAASARGRGAVPDPKRSFPRIAGRDLARLAEDRLG